MYFSRTLLLLSVDLFGFVLFGVLVERGVGGKVLTMSSF